MSQITIKIKNDDFDIEIEKHSITITDFKFDSEILSHSSSGIYPPVDDEEWMKMSENERNEFFIHLEKGLKFESKTLTIDDLDKMIEKRRQKI